MCQQLNRVLRDQDLSTSALPSLGTFYPYIYLHMVTRWMQTLQASYLCSRQDIERKNNNHYMCFFDRKSKVFPRIPSSLTSHFLKMTQWPLQLKERQRKKSICFPACTVGWQRRKVLGMAVALASQPAQPGRIVRIL